MNRTPGPIGNSQVQKQRAGVVQWQKLELPKLRCGLDSIGRSHDDFISRVSPRVNEAISPGRSSNQSAAHRDALLQRLDVLEHVGDFLARVLGVIDSYMLTLLGASHRVARDVFA